MEYISQHTETDSVEVSPKLKYFMEASVTLQDYKQTISLPNTT